MGADEPGFDVAEQGMDDREELAGIGAFVLHHWRVLQMPVEGGVAAAIACEPVGQQMRPGCDIGLEKGVEFGTRRQAARRSGRCRRRTRADASRHGRVFPSCSSAPAPSRPPRQPGSCRGWRCCARDWSDRPGRRCRSHPPRGSHAAGGSGLRSARAAAYAPWSTPSDTPPPVPVAGTWPRRRACRGPSGRRQQTTSRGQSASDETPSPPSPIPADGRCCIRRPVAAP
jgi:hypothetical protein